MALTAGTRLGPYEIVAAVGAGGMGEVYRARDTRLDRDVALKVLPASLAADPEIRARFEREARAISQLNHPHICGLYDVGRQDDIDYLVMEYLDGESLATRLERGPIPTDEALDYAVQIADALDKAHRQGVVHRDLKPGNVMLVKGGAARSVVSTARTAPSIAKLLDFGLAKFAPPPTAGSLETVMASGLTKNASRAMPTQPATAHGTILGTFQYMAPEQIEAQDVDARADIWAFGCLLYEMLTGRRAFDGKSHASLIASILSRDPTPVVELQPLTPPALSRVLRICLAKDRDARFQSSYDLLLQLQWIAEGGSAAGLPAPVIEHRKRRERTMWVGAALATLIIGAASAWMLKPAPVISNISERFSFALPDDQRFTRTGRRYLAISPDGARMAYIANSQIYLREMDQLAAKPVPGTSEDPLDLVFSPDGLSIAYFVTDGGGASTGPGSTLKKIQIGGGTPVPICTTAGFPFGASWSGHTIVFGQNNAQVKGIQSVPDTSGTPTTLVTLKENEQASMPSLIADGRLVLFTVRTNQAASWDTADVVVQTPGGADRTVLVKGGSDGRLVDHRLIYYKSSTLFGIGFDERARATRGGPVPIVERVKSSLNATGTGIFATASNGTLVFVPGTANSASEARQLVWVDRQGKEEPIAGLQDGPYSHPRLSPDGRRIVIAEDGPADSKILTFELDRRLLTSLPTGKNEQVGFPIWARDGRTVIYRSGSPDGDVRLMRIDASGAGAAEPVIDLGRISATLGIPDSMSPDGRTLVIRGSADALKPLPDLLTLPLDDTNRTPRSLLANPTTAETNGIISPDGKWLAYALQEAGGARQQAFIRPYPDVMAGRWPLSSTNAEFGAGDIAWSRSGREVFFITNSPDNQVFSVSVQPGPVFGRATALFSNKPYMPTVNPGVDYDVALDGRFLMVKPRSLYGEDTTKPTITVVTHWTDELRAKVK